MSGTEAGGAKAGATNKKRYGADYYARIGQMGGKKSTGGGFAISREHAQECGRKGGTISRRGPTGVHKEYTPEEIQERKEKAKARAAKRYELVKQLIKEHRERFNAS